MPLRDMYSRQSDTGRSVAGFAFAQEQRGRIVQIRMRVLILPSVARTLTPLRIRKQAALGLPVCRIHHFLPQGCRSVQTLNERAEVDDRGGGHVVEAGPEIQTLRP